MAALTIWRLLGIVIGLFIIGGAVSFLLAVTVDGETIDVNFLLRFFGALSVALFGVILFLPLGGIVGLVVYALVTFLQQSVARYAARRLLDCQPLGRIGELSARVFNSGRLEGEATMYAALALVRGKPSAQMLDWLERSLGQTRFVQGGGIVAAGLIAALRGDRHLARCFLLVADTLDWRLIPRSARIVARDWLVVDASLIGNWREVIRLGRRGRSSMRWSYTVSRIAERLSGDKQACDDWLLRLCWIIAPRRRATLALLRRAVALPRVPTPSALRESACTDLPQALANMAHRLKNMHTHDDLALLQAVHDIDTKIDSPGTRALIQRRLVALGAQHDPDAVISDFRQSLTDVFVPLIETSPALARHADRIAVLREARECARRRLFRDIEAQCKDYDARIKSQNHLGELAEWEIWARLRERADRLLRVDPASEMVLFETMKFPVWNFALFQGTKGKRYELAHDMYAWLRRHSHSDPLAARALLNNMRAVIKPATSSPYHLEVRYRRF
jgi:hypothetical protein